MLVHNSIYCGSRRKPSKSLFCAVDIKFERCVNLCFVMCLKFAIWQTTRFSPFWQLPNTNVCHLVVVQTTDKKAIIMNRQNIFERNNTNANLQQF